MRILLDTHLLLWAAAGSSRLPAQARAAIAKTDNDLIFSAASLWEVAIKHSLGRRDFRSDPRVLRRGLLDNGYLELPITGAHAAAVAGLASLHRDPFDRMLIAQATTEGIWLMTSDPLVAQYPGPIEKV